MHLFEQGNITAWCVKLGWHRQLVAGGPKAQEVVTKLASNDRQSIMKCPVLRVLENIAFVGNLGISSHDLLLLRNTGNKVASATRATRF
jgi:hypothetical protein